MGTSALRGVLIAAAVLVAQATGWAGPGFGTLRKKSIELQTRQPAVVRLAHTTIAFAGSASNPAWAGIVDGLLATLDVEMMGNEKTLTKKRTAAEAEWLLGLKVTGFSVGQPQTRTDRLGKNSISYTRWTGSLVVAYQVIDHRGRVHDSNSVNYPYSREFDQSQTGSTVMKSKIPGPVPVFRKSTGETVPHSQEDVKQIMIKEVVQQIASNLGNTTKTVDVQAAGGDDHLNRSVDFMEKQLWSRALDELEKMTPFSKPEDEAYRQYNLGLVYEAMSYDAQSANDQRANLFKAAEYYDKALESNSREKYFVESVARTKDAIARYKALNLMKEDDRKRQTPVSAAKSAPAPTAAEPPTVIQQPPAKGGKVIRVNDVIEMYAAGVAAPQITAVIRNASVEFDPLDKDTLVAIARAKLPLTLENEMRKKVGAPLRTPAPPAAPVKKK